MLKGARRVLSGFVIVTYYLICGVCSIRMLMSPSFDKFIELFIYLSVQTKFDLYEMFIVSRYSYVSLMKT